MNIFFWILILSFTLFSCSAPQKVSEFSDNYALIEFAAKLEEEEASANSMREEIPDSQAK